MENMKNVAGKEVVKEEREFVICFHCGEEIAKEEAYEFEGEYFCNEEEAEDYVVCRDCGKLVKVENTEYDNCNDNYVCVDCYQKNEYITCEDCGEITSDWVEINDDKYGKYVCSDCANENYYCCDRCGEYFERDIVHTDDCGHVICDDCYEDYGYYTCEDCGEIIRECDVFWVDDLPYCESCYDSHKEEEAITYYDYKPTPVFYKNDNEDVKKGLLYMGIELEIDAQDKSSEEAEDEARYIKEKLPHVYCKHDGSLDDGFENVTHPCTLAYHMNCGYKEVFEKIIRDGWKSHNTSTCGLHVHVNRDYLGTNEDMQDLVIAKIMLIMDRVWDNGLVNFTRRESSKLNEWAKRCNMNDSENDTEKEVICKSKRFKDCGRYYALNLRNKNTIEFRLFRGTLKYNTFIATLQFVSNLVNYAKDHTLQDIQRTNITMNTIFEYKEYEELNQYAKERKLITEAE